MTRLVLLAAPIPWSRGKSRRRRAAILAIFAVLVGSISVTRCDPLSRADHQAVRRWLLCEECSEGERDAVVALGDRAVGALGEALQAPPAEGLETVRRRAEENFQRVRAGRMDRSEYVAHFTENYRARYQSRAAIALGLIGTASARTLLIEAARHDSAYREDVQGFIGSAAGIRLTIQDGDSQSAPVDSVLRQLPTVLVSDSATGLGIAGIRVVFQVDSGGGSVMDSVLRSDTAGLAATRWRMGHTPGVNLMRATAAGQTVWFRADGRAPGPALVFTVQPSTTQAGQPITPPVRIEARDEWGQTLTNYNNTVVVRVPGAGWASVRPMVNGVSVFSNLVMLVPPAVVQLRATSLGFPPALSDSFTISP